MTTPGVRFTNPVDVVAALHDPRLVPPAMPPDGGATLALRAAMARFSAPADHGSRRAAVEAAVRAIDVEQAADVAAYRTAARLDDTSAAGSRVELIADVARPVAVATIAACLGVDDEQLEAVVLDVDAVAAVVGRGGAPSTHSDEAAGRLMERFAAHQCGAVAAVSLLYQSMDATAALIAVRALDGADEHPSGLVPVPRTRRIATEATSIGGKPIAAGTDVDVEIGEAGHWFGAGPHACPGRSLAEAITDATLRTLSRRGWAVETGSADVDADGRPTQLWICSAGER